MQSSYWGATKPPRGVPLERGDPLTANLLGFWPLNECNGGRVYDATGRNPSLGLTASWVGSKYGRAIYSSSTSTTLVASGVVSTALQNLTGDCTAFGWISYASLAAATDALPWNTIIGWADYSYQPFTLGADNANLTWCVANAFALTRTSLAYTLSLNTWYHICGVRRNTTIEFYVNGAIVGSAAQNGTAAVETANSFQLLGGGGFRETNGTLVAAGVWGRALTATEVHNTYAATYQVFAAPVWRRYFVPQVVSLYPPWRQDPMRGLLQQ